MSGVLRQTAVVTGWNLRGLAARVPQVSVAVLGFFGVVLVFVGVLSIRAGFARMMRSSASPEVAYVFANGTRLSQADLAVLAQAPGVARGPGGARVAGMFIATARVPLPGRSVKDTVNVRGVPAGIGGVWRKFRIVAGRMVRPGLDEIVVGQQAARQFPALRVGRWFDWDGRAWKVVGVFSMGGGIRESEIWTSVRQLQQVYNASGHYQDAIVRLSSPAAFSAFKRWVEHNPQLNVNAERATRLFRQQAGDLDGPIALVGGVVTLLMAIGAIFGAMNIMYAALAARMREIATLRAVGFARAPILCAVLAEGMLLGTVGGGLATLIAYLIFNGYHASTIANGALTEFSFAVTPALVLVALVTAVVMGVIGGLFPALRAARCPLARALREG